METSGFFEKLHRYLRKELRAALGRKRHPTAGIVDSQSVKTTERGGLKGYDGVKKVKGRKRHLLVDTQGFLLKGVVTPANLGDREGLLSLLEKMKRSFKRLKKNMGRHGLPGKQDD